MLAGYARVSTLDQLPALHSAVLQNPCNSRVTGGHKRPLCHMAVEITNRCRIPSWTAL